VRVSLGEEEEEGMSVAAGAGPAAGAAPAADVLLVSLGATGGLRAADAELCESLRRAGAQVELVTAARPREVRTLALTDLAWALSARRAALEAIATHRPKSIVYSSVTAALLWPRPGAIRFDAVAARNRPRRHGLWQRPLERSRLAAAPLLLPCAEGSLDGLPPAMRGEGREIVLPIPVEPSEPAAGDPGRDSAAITYAANPAKKGLDRVLAAWAQARRPGEQLIVAGTSEHELRRAGIEGDCEGAVFTGMLSSAEYRGLLRRARAFVCAPRFEDYGIAQLEALIDGCMLVTTPAPGPYAALPLARRLDERLVSGDLAAALRIALDDPRADYARRAQEALRPWRRGAVDALVAERVLPRLLTGR
jgi:glycosyltransferase involved in cell wall biosynthesis